MSRKPSPIRHDYPLPEYVYRRRLEPRELLPAVGAAVGVGLAAFYVARLLLQRTPLVAPVQRPVQRPVPRPAARPVQRPVQQPSRTSSAARPRAQSSGSRSDRPSHPSGRA